MSKIYLKTVHRCDECPAIGYIHFDGEGESCPYEFWNARCQLTFRDLPQDMIINEGYATQTKYGYVPKRKIPVWCPLADANKGVQE